MTENPRAFRLDRLLAALVVVLAMLTPSAAFGASTPSTPTPTGNIGFTVTTPSPTPHTPTPSPSASNSGQPIPNTGGPSVWWLVAGLFLVGVGVIVAMVSRRRIMRH